MPHWLDTLFVAPSATIIGATILAGIFGGFVRGYSGFGFALAAVPILTLVLPPVIAIPAVLPIELAIGLVTLPHERTHVAWQPCGWLVAGTIVGTPLGLTVLAAIPAEPMRIVIGVLVIVAAAILWRRPVLSDASLGRYPLLGAGLISGLLNGGTAMSGPPAIVALLGSKLETRAVRATLIAFIAFSAALGLTIAATRGLITPETATVSALMLPSAALGGALGLAVFSWTPNIHYRPASLALLALVSVSAVVSTSLSLLRSSQL